MNHTFIRSILITSSALLLSVNLIIPLKAIAQGAPTKDLVGAIFSIRGRCEKDHRMRLVEETYKGKPRVHVYLVTSSQTLPYMVSLGWLRITDTIIPKPAPKKRSFKLRLKFKPKVKVPFSKKEKNLLNPSKKKTVGLNVVDENNFVIPALTETAIDTSRKVDIKQMAGFDSLIDNDVDKALKFYRSCIEDEPDDPKFQNNYGVLLALKGEFAKASKHLDLAIEANSKYTNAITNRSLLELAIGAPEIALKDAEAALENDPNLLPARIAQARALLESNKIEKALQLASKLKQQYSADWQTLLLLADAQLRNNRFKAAKKTLNRLSVLAPSSSDLLLKLAHAEYKLGDLDSAIKHARKATQVGGNDPKTHIALAQYLSDNQDLNAATLQLERALELKPDKKFRKRAMANLLSIYLKKNKTEEAFLLTEKWAKTYSRDAHCHFNKAWIASKMKGTEYRDIAISEYLEAIELDSKLASVRYNLALLLVNAKKYDQALKQLNAFVKLSPEDKDVEQAKALIDKLTKK